MKKGSKQSEASKQKVRDSIAARGGSWCKGMKFPHTTHCKRGHEFTPENTYTHPSNGCRSCRACIDSWHAEHPTSVKAAARKYSWNWRLKNLYHLTQEEYDRRYVEQKGLCILPSCEAPIGATDHDKINGRTRGLMCVRHNLGMGHFSHNPQLLREAAEYLEKFNGEQFVHGADVGGSM
jgi:hypothetical protein